MSEYISREAAVKLFDAWEKQYQDHHDDTAAYCMREVKRALVEDIDLVKAFSIEELDEFYDELYDSEGGDSYTVYKGVRYSIDAGYAYEGIRMYLECLKRKLGIEKDGKA